MHVRTVSAVMITMMTMVGCDPMKMRCRIRVVLSVVVLSTDHSVLASAFVQCWRVYVDEPVVVRVDLVTP